MIRNHKWRDYGLQKVKVTDTRHYTESERFNIKLQVANYWLLEMKSLKYFVEFLCEFFEIQHHCETPRHTLGNSHLEYYVQTIVNLVLTNTSAIL